MHDIQNRKDIELLVDSFYIKVKKDPTIGYIFTQVMKVDWDSHLPKMYRFWESILLDKITYKGNPMVKHIQIDKSESLHPEHFKQWNKLFAETLDELFLGKIANEAKSRGELMANLMLYKIGESRKKNFIQ